MLVESSSNPFSFIFLLILSYTVSLGLRRDLRPQAFICPINEAQYITPVGTLTPIGSGRYFPLLPPSISVIGQTDVIPYSRQKTPFGIISVSSQANSVAPNMVAVRFSETS